MSQDYKILLTGGSGTLGKELIKLFKEKNIFVFSPTSSELNILDPIKCTEWFKNHKPNLVIHAAAYTDVKASEENYIKSINTNIVGTCNIINCCSLHNAKLVYISTEHVFDGKKGLYTKEDYINPITKYAKSKASAELAVRMYDNSLVIRTSFFSHNFPYDTAFIDQWSSKDYIDIIAPKIFKACLSNKFGILHCGSQRRSLYDIAAIRKKDIIKISREDFKFPILKDTSLIVDEEYNE